ncbi:MAG: TIGR03087 family PEP-CTERM/XrtA system glycosyltransferase [Alphaproteobacteria bacterium]|nr:TIGR03087 family PEP-CTERM/XrtA system glycosyltransferase [Alphaproteobacteria bacterium]
MNHAVLIAHRFPYPPDKGDRIRTWNLLTALSRHYVVHVGAFVHEPVSAGHVEAVKAACRGRCHFEPVNGLVGRARALLGLATGEPLSVRFLASSAMRRWVDDIVAAGKPELAVASASTVAPYAARVGAARSVLDLVDVDSDKWRQYAATRRGAAAWLYAREADKLLAFERALIARFDATLLTTPHEVATMRALVPGHGARIHHFGNGVDHAYFSPDRRYPDPYPAGTRAIVLTGSLDYWPNVDAAVWFAREALPLVRAHAPDAMFYAVGHNPAADVVSLGARDGVHVVGGVPDVRPYLAHAAAVVAPLRVARGVQNKVLEAMAMGRPVVTTSKVMQGILATPATELLVADEPQDFAEAVLGALDNRIPAMGLAARARILADYSWATQYDRLDAIIGGIAPDAQLRSRPA